MLIDYSYKNKMFWCSLQINLGRGSIFADFSRFLWHYTFYLKLETGHETVHYKITTLSAKEI